MLFTFFHKKEISVSLCISTYNRPDALTLCLQSIKTQTYKPFEVIIADDGSGNDTKVIIDNIRKNFPIPIKHVWHPDYGFRLAEIRNKAIAAASGNYIIQIDGDLLLHKNFIKNHINVAQENTFIAGARSLISEQATKAILQENGLVKQINFRMLEKKYNAFEYKPLLLINYFFNRGGNLHKYVLGANMAFWKKDLIKVNGYNEDFLGWGKEDNDIAIRLMNANVKIRSLKFGGVVYHLYHKGADTVRHGDNDALYKKSIEKGLYFVTNGLNKHGNIE